MKRIVQTAATLGLLLVAPSCATGVMARALTMTPDAERPRASEDSAAIDDVTNGDVSRGFFADDGKEGDFRGRTENYFDFVQRPAEKGQSGGLQLVIEPADAPEDGLDRKMIYTAQFTVMVTTTDEAISQLLTKTTELGGYLARRHNTTLTVRVPAAKFRALLAAIPELGRVLSESMNANDVTDQHTDLTIRLENAAKSRQRLLALLEKATKVEDMIKIEDALRRLTGEIERMKGQLKLMNDQVAFSTVTVDLKANAPQAKSRKQRRRSRFYWINRIGIEQDLRRY